MRIIIAGVVKSGKTTLSDQFIGPVYHTDDLMDMEWSEQSEEISKWFDDEAPWVVEGMAAPRSLRKWLIKNKDLDKKPADLIIWLNEPKEDLSDEQENMGKSAVAVFDGIINNLEDLGVEVIGYW